MSPITSPHETAEAYILGHLDERDAITFETHYLNCPVCQAALSEEDETIRAFRGASRFIAAK